MAKRIKIKGKTPDGYSKLRRVITHQWEKNVGDDSPMESWPTDVLKAIEKAKRGGTAPSSTRKKRVKQEGEKRLGTKLRYGQRRQTFDSDFEDFESIGSPTLKAKLREFLINRGLVEPF